MRLQSSDGEIFVTGAQIAKCSDTIKNMLEDCGMDETEDAIVPLPNVNAAILRKVLEWANYHKDDPVELAVAEQDDKSMPTDKSKKTDDILPWDADFMKIDQRTMFQLILAANYLDIKNLMDLTCKTVANMIKGKSPEEIRKTFNGSHDFTEEVVVRKENSVSEKIQS